MLFTLLGLLIVGYAPGAVMLRLPGRTRPRRAALPADERLFWSLVLSAAWSLGIVLALASMGWYSLPRLLGINGGAVAVALIVGRDRLRFGPGTARIGWPALVPTALVVLGVWLYNPPSEYVLGGRDPGTYINEGIQIAQRGALVVADPVVASVPSDFRDLFFPSHQSPTYYSVRFVGYWIQDPARGTVVGQFPHLFPASIAVGYGLNGLSGARQAGVYWAVLGLLAVYFAGSRLFGRPAAAAAAALLAVNVATVWFARYPVTEGLMQTFLFAAILALTHALVTRQVFFGVVAGVLSCGLLFLRYDAILVVGAMAGAATIAAAVRQRPGPAFWTAGAVTFAMGAWYLSGPMRAYLAPPLDGTRRIGGFWILPACLALAWLVPRVLDHERVAAIVKRVVPPALAASLVALAVYAYFIRDEGGRLALGDAMAFRAFGWWYMTPWALGLAVAGMAWFVSRRFWQAPAFFVTLSLFSVFFFYKTRIVHEHFWTARRFIPIILPGALLLVTGLVQEIVGPERLAALARQIRRPGTDTLPRWVGFAGVAAMVVALAPLGQAFWTASDPVRHHVEYAGLIPHLEDLAGRFSDRDLVIVESRNAGSDLHVLGMPLAYIYARHVLILDSPVPPKRRLEAFLTWARSRYDTIWFVGGGGTDLLTARFTAEPVGGATFQVPEYAATYNAYPTEVRRKEFEYGLYQLVPAPIVARGPVHLDIGVNDDVHVVRFHAKERRGDTGTTFRWSGDLSYVLLQGIAPDARELTVWMSSGGRPPEAPAGDVELTLAGRVLGQATPDDPIRPYTFAIPTDLAAQLAASDDPARLEVRVATWNPAEILGGPDTRDLGVLVTRVDVE